MIAGIYASGFRWKENAQTYLPKKKGQEDEPKDFNFDDFFKEEVKRIEERENAKCRKDGNKIT